MYFVPCVARSDGTHQQRICRIWKLSRHTSQGSGRANAVGNSPCTAVGSGPRTAQCQQNPAFCGYSITCATPSLVIVQRRAPCLCNADPCALMTVQCRSRCHDLHTLGPPHPFLPIAVRTQPCAKRCKICIRGAYLC